MSEIESAVAAHYAGDGSVIDRILDALTAAGFSTDTLDPAVLATVDEFHLGGRPATEALIEALELTPESVVLDVGCGIGGAARTIAASVGCRVTGVDLTPEFIEAARALSDRTGLGVATSFSVGSATRLDFDDDSFDAATMLHVGMNIADKDALCREIARVVRPGGTVAVYDVMRIGEGEVTMPVPWAPDQASSFLASVDDYVAAMRTAGLTPDPPVDETVLVLEVVAATQAAPPPVDLRTLVGPDISVSFGNLMAAIKQSVVAPVRIVARR